SGANITGLTFGQFQRISLSGQVFQDTDGSGVPTGKPGAGGRTVFLDANGNGVVDPGEAAATTNGAGQFTFASLGPGSYRVREVVASGDVQTTTNPADVAAQSGVNVGGLNFGTFTLASLSGQVFNDTDGSGAGAGKPGLAGFTVFLDANGN